MKENKSRRAFLSNSGKMVTAAALFGATAPMAYAATSGAAVCETKGTMNITDSHYYLDNVLLEAGFEYEGAVVRIPVPRDRPWRFRTVKSWPCATTKTTRTPRCRTMTRAAN